jgi:gas vesicle protein
MENGKTQKIAAAFILGTIVGGVLTLLYAPKSGKGTRQDISTEIKKYINGAAGAKDKLIERAKVLSNDLVEQSEKVYSDIKKFQEGKYSGTAEKIEGELTKLRSAIKTAIDSYKDARKVRRFFPDEDKYYFTDFSEYLFQDEEDETLPKFESMKKRKN